MPTSKLIIKDTAKLVVLMTGVNVTTGSSFTAANFGGATTNGGNLVLCDRVSPWQIDTHDGFSSTVSRSDTYPVEVARSGTYIGVALADAIVLGRKSSSPATVYEFDVYPAATTASSYAPGGIELVGVAYDGTNIWLAYENGDIKEVSYPGGTPVSNFSLSSVTLAGIAYDPVSGNLITAQNTASRGINIHSGKTSTISSFLAYDPGTSLEDIAVMTLYTDISPDGIASAEAFGSTEVNHVAISPAGIASAEAFGAAEIRPGQLFPSGVASGEVFGSVELSPQQLFLTGLSSAEAFGAVIVGPVQPVGIASAEAFGVATVGPIQPTGIVSTEAFGTTRLIRELADSAGDVYKIILTGDADATTDLDLSDRMKSFQGRARNDKPTYAAVVLSGVDNVTDISERTNGQIVIYKGSVPSDGTLIEYDEILRVDFETLRQDEGGNSASLTISGHNTEEYSSPITVALVGVIYRADNGGVLQFRAAVNNFLRPGDVATYGGDAIIVGEISYTVGGAQQTMEVLELAA